MNYTEALSLEPGDEVKWTDPDGGWEHIYVIRSIAVNGDIVIIEDRDGSCLECFCEELS